MMELRTRLAPEPEIFYQEHGAYPQKLHDLPLEEFDWGTEGATPTDLESFSYVSDGPTFVLLWKGEGGYEVYLAGHKGESNYFKKAAASKAGNELRAQTRTMDSVWLPSVPAFKQLPRRFSLAYRHG